MATLERYQLLIYLVAIAGGLAGGYFCGEPPEWLPALLWPTLGLLLYATFLQIPLARIGAAFGDSRFTAAALGGNFLLLPLLAWGLTLLLPPDPALRLGVMLVLLMPCTDWFITFTHLGGGDSGRAVALAPLSLLLQLILLPFYLWLFLGSEFAVNMARGQTLLIFAAVVLLPLTAAWLTEKWEENNPNRPQPRQRLAWLPVPLLGLVLFIVAVSQINNVLDSLAILPILLLVFTLFLLGAALLARALAYLLELPPGQGRTLAFSFGTRNSFVVLPLALTLPAALEAAVVVIVFQSLVELFGMIAYLRWVPHHLFPRK